MGQIFVQTRYPHQRFSYECTWHFKGKTTAKQHHLSEYYLQCNAILENVKVSKIVDLSHGHNVYQFITTTPEPHNFDTWVNV